MRTQQEILQKTEDLRLRLALLSAEKNHSSMLDPTRELEILALVDKLEVLLWVLEQDLSGPDVMEVFRGLVNKLQFKRHLAN